MAFIKEFSIACPIPLSRYPQIVMAHGGGGKLMQELIENMFLKVFGNNSLSSPHDSAILQSPSAKLAMTTDSFVVRPLVFPGGDIGKLAVNGTVNDLAMSGARPLYLSVGFILEEGLAMQTLWQIVLSMKEAADAAHVKIITGDTKVVDKGKGDGIFINTTGIGAIEHHLDISAGSIQAHDAIIINGDLGRHGIAIMAVREGLEFESVIESDSAPLSHLVERILKSGIQIHCMRDLTRGGLASVLNEISQASTFSMDLDEALIPVREDVKGACEILGFDPLYVANEGRFALFIEQKDVEKTLKIMRAHPQGQGSCVVGRVACDPSGIVRIKSRIGATRIMDMLSGEQLPRIC